MNDKQTQLWPRSALGLSLLKQSMHPIEWRSMPSHCECRVPSDTAARENRTTARENRTSARENRSCTRKQVFSPLVFFAVLTHLTTPTCVNASQSQFCKRISHFVQLQSHSSSGGVQRIVQLQNQGSSCNDTTQTHASLATWANQSIYL